MREQEKWRKQTDLQHLYELIQADWTIKPLSHPNSVSKEPAGFASYQMSEILILERKVPVISVISQEVATLLSYLGAIRCLQVKSSFSVHAILDRLNIRIEFHVRFVVERSRV